MNVEHYGRNLGILPKEIVLVPILDKKQEIRMGALELEILFLEWGVHYARSSLDQVRDTIKQRSRPYILVALLLSLETLTLALHLAHLLDKLHVASLVTLDGLKTLLDSCT